MSSNRMARWLPIVFLVPAVAVTDGVAQEGELRDEPPPIPVEEIIDQFVAKETEFAQARANYTYRQDITVHELDADDRIGGEYRMVSEILFEDNGRTRTERIVFAPQSTLERIQLTPQDLERYESIQPFVMTEAEVHLYDIEYTGKQQIDEIDCYVFEVGPRVMEEGELYFEGRIWVDDLDLQIVKTFGKTVPDIRDGDQDNLFPRFETYRQQIDGVYWFPTYTRALDTLEFRTGPVRIREVIRYEDYQRFEADVSLTFGDEVEVDAPPDEEPDN